MDKKLIEWASAQRKNRRDGKLSQEHIKMLDEIGFDWEGQQRSVLSLAEAKPEVAQEWHPTKNGKFTPDDIAYSSAKMFWWKCNKGHEWQARVRDRYYGSGCPYCTNHKVLAGYNDLATLFPDVAAEWHPTKNGTFTPADVMPGSRTKVWWLCKNGHEWLAEVRNRRAGCGCPYCANIRPILGVNDLATLNPALASEWHPSKNGELMPSDVMAKSRKSVWWVCENGHEWQAIVRDRSEGNGCPYCSGYKAIPGLNDLATVNPALAAEWHPSKNGALTPSVVKPKSGKTVWWRCQKGHEWQATIYNRTNGCGCPFCSKSLVSSGTNDLATLNPNIAAEWHPTKNGALLPKDVTSGSEMKVWWQCKKGHEWESPVYARSKGRGCPYCAGKRVLVGFNDLATKNPLLACEWHPTKNGSLSPSDVTAGSGKKVWWKCVDGHEWAARIADRNSGKGCPICANRSRKRK